MVIIRATVAKVMQKQFSEDADCMDNGGEEESARMNVATPFLFRDGARIVVTLPFILALFLNQSSQKCKKM